MRISRPFFLIMIAIFTFPCVKSQNDHTNENLAHAEYQTKLLLEEVINTSKGKGKIVPRTLTKYGELHLVNSRNWTSGFFPGTLWLLYEMSEDKFWMEQAELYTKMIEKEKFDGESHDVGFKIYCSFGNGYRLTGQEEYRNVILQAAKTLITRYDPKIGAIRSWDHNDDKWDYPVIIDNLMNLELLFAATRFSGDSTYYDIAVDHANTTLENHFREDNSSYHVVDFNPETGEVQGKNTHQGYSDESDWARGQAWGLYGYVMIFRETDNNIYLDQAKKIANFLLSHPHLPNDMIPYWDFDVTDLENEPRDVSSAAIMASALYELSCYSNNQKKYKEAADQILKSINSKYRSPKGHNKGFILQNSTGHKPKNSEIDVPLNYADYYYLEALLRKRKLKKDMKLFKE